MRKGSDILNERAADAGITLGSSIPLPVFTQLGLPAVVACTGCGMTMVMPSCLVDDDDQCWCRDCAGEDEDEEASPNESPEEPEIDESMNPYDGTFDWENDRSIIGEDGQSSLFLF